MADEPKGKNDPTAIAVKDKEIAFRPKNFEELWKFATLICKTDFVPPAFKENAGACLAAIQTGHELGLPPMASLQSIAVINGRPTVWGDGALALVKAHRLCEWVHELPAEEALKSGYGECTIKRRGDPVPTTRKFSLEMAHKAGLIDRSGPKGVWATYQGRMLQMRARAWAMRDAIPEALKGVAIREEVEDYEQAEVVQDKQLPAPNGKPALEQLKESLKAEVPKPDPEPAKEPEQPEPKREEPPQGLTPMQALIDDINSLSTPTGIREMDKQLKKRMKEAGIKEDADILAVCNVFNKRQVEIFGSAELPET